MSTSTACHYIVICTFSATYTSATYIGFYNFLLADPAVFQRFYNEQLDIKNTYGNLRYHSQT